MCRASGAGEDETTQVICLRMTAVLRVLLAMWRPRGGSRPREEGAAGRRAEELLSEAQTGKKNQPASVCHRLSVQPPHLWCCFASPQKETVVGHVASGGSWEVDGGEEDKEYAASRRVNVRRKQEEKGFSSTAGRHQSQSGSSALLGRRGTAWAGAWRKDRSTPQQDNLGVTMVGVWAPSLRCRGSTRRGRDAPAALLLLSSAPLTQCSRPHRPAPPTSRLLDHMSVPDRHKEVDTGKRKVQEHKEGAQI